jgi:hypothetical protein
MQTPSNAAVDTTLKAGAEKAHEKLAEKRRALGRGLESRFAWAAACANRSRD